MNINTSFMIVVTVALVLMAGVLYLAPKYNRWVDRHNKRK